ncbi:MAG: GIY-YIG nuclease family protein [candidate division Zixibacteria bacterium]|nr:GIY-YIG nuclease family protein [candidate division Zixibacteria bacterium]
MTNGRKPWFVYLVRCRDGSIYAGITDDINARIKKHNSGKGATYTAQRRPVTLLFSEPHPDQSSARRREIQLKGWTREKKEQLIAGFPRPHSG